MDMQKWKEVVIRPSDKGSKYFLLDRNDYKDRVHEHIYDATTFVKVNQEQAEHKCKNAILNWLNVNDKEPGLTEKMKTWIMPDERCKPGNNYVNPKAHKPEKNYPGRMISTGCAAMTKNLSALTAHELTKVKLKYAIQDLNQFLRTIEDINKSDALKDKDVIHVSFDIESMFPSIAKEVGLEECRTHLEKRPKPHLFSTNSIIDALEITLDNNITQFDNETFKQIKGTAMGPKNAGAYADTAINRIDEYVMEGDFDSKPVVWLRFRDDIYVPWTHGIEKLKEFLEWLNTRMPGIKFTMRYSKDGTVFLETFVYNKGMILHTKPYSKECDDHTFLVPSSCHPTHTLRNIPYSTALRLYKISSEPLEYEKSKVEYTAYLLERGYNLELIKDAFKKVELKGRLEYTETTTKNIKKKKFYPLVTEFNPALPNIGHVLNKHKHVLELDSELCSVIRPESIFTSFRSAKTLHDLLVHSRLPMLNNNSENSDEDIASTSNEVKSDSNGCWGCKKGCNFCKFYLKQTKIAYSYHTNSVFKINSNIDCNSENVIYIINNKTTKVSSVGCTSNCTRERFRNHKSHIKKMIPSCEVSTHIKDNWTLHALDTSTFEKYDKSLSTHLEVILIEKVEISADIQHCAKERLKVCKRREWYWQNQLKTLRKYGGLNIREEKSYP